MPINESIKFELLGIVEQLRDAILKAAGEDIPSVPGPVPAAAKPITSVTIENTGGDQTNVPVTFGQVFAPGDLPAGMGLKDAQLDVKATHPDGSVRHGVVSLIVPKLVKGAAIKFDLVPQKPSASREVLTTKLEPVAVDIVVDGEKYSAVPDIPNEPWLNGPVVREINCTSPLKDKLGNEHRHLSVRLAYRHYYGINRVRVEAVVENTWAYEPNPQNFIYDLELKTGNSKVQQKAITHYHHARQRLVTWVGEEPKIHVRHDPTYLMATKAVPNYDSSIVIDEKTLAAYEKGWTGPKTEPMGVGIAMRSMGSSGGRSDIGLLPGWAVDWLISQDARAAMITLGTANLSGSWSCHYRDKNTGLPVSLFDYPYITIEGRETDTRNPVTKKYEAVPKLVKGEGGIVNKHESSHQPDLAYLPYLLTGDYYYLEEIQFWAMWNVTSTTPGYRRFDKGLVHRTQLRGQAWNLRSLIHAAYITPDAHSLKSQFVQLVDNNLDWYNETYTNNPNANKLGFINGHADMNVNYEGGKAIALFQDDFFTSSVARALELGFEKARPLLEWKTKFTVERMVGEGVCWINGAGHATSSGDVRIYRVRDSADGEFYKTIGEAYKATFGEHVASLKCGDEVSIATKRKPNDMGGAASSAIGYPSTMQPAIAYAAQYGGKDAQRAWELFMSRSVKPNYGKDGAQFAIVPRAN